VLATSIDTVFLVVMGVRPYDVPVVPGASYVEFIGRRFHGFPRLGQKREKRS